LATKLSPTRTVLPGVAASAVVFPAARAVVVARIAAVYLVGGFIFSFLLVCCLLEFPLSRISVFQWNARILVLSEMF